eukprot:c39486_g1_i1 orf=74-508(+)
MVGSLADSRVLGQGKSWLASGDCLAGRRAVEKGCQSANLCGGRVLSIKDRRFGGRDVKFGQGQFKEALDRVEAGGTTSVDVSTFARLLRFCGNEKALADGKRVHFHIVRCGFDGDRYLQNLLVEMYGKCGVVESARAVFEKIHR